jgi:signal peptidase I
MKLNKKLLIFIILALTGLFFYPQIKRVLVSLAPDDARVPQLVTKDQCLFDIQERIVRGDSLSGLIEAGEGVKIDFGFYACNEIRREDIVIYNFLGNSEPIIKVVKGLPGDKFNFQQSGDYWQLLINEEIVRNSFGEVYKFNEHSYNLLNLYVKDYEGIMPADTYLILGNLTNGSLDSSRFGLVAKGDILGKVVDVLR